MRRLTRDGTAEPVSRDQIIRREYGQGNMYFPYSADHVQDWQPYPVDPYSCYLTLAILLLLYVWQYIHTGAYIRPRLTEEIKNDPKKVTEI